MLSQVSRALVITVLAVVGSSVDALGQTPVGTGFDYQGRLEQDGQPVNGLCDIRARLYDVPTGGLWLGTTQCFDHVNVQDGLFTIQIDFGATAFAGEARWLDIGVRQDSTVGNCSAGGYTPLTPRQALTAAPYTTYASVAGFAAGPWASAGGDVSLTGGNVGIGTTSPAVPLHVASGTDVSPTGGGYFMTGSPTGLNIACDSNEIMARNNGAASELYLNHNGGDVLIGAGGGGGNVVIGAGATSAKLSAYGGSARALYVDSNYGFASAWIRNSAGGAAAVFTGNVDVVGQLSKSGGSFRIDHPLDPANKYLYHSFVESPDMKNLYDGVVITDARGYATIEMPDWFEPLNRDFRYQLTVIDASDGDAFVLAKVVREIADRKFTIRTNRGSVKVSWQVTGTRHDPWAEARRIPVEQEKPAHERGKYQHPELYGLPQEMGISHQPAR